MDWYLREHVRKRTPTDRLGQGDEEELRGSSLEESSIREERVETDRTGSLPSVRVISNKQADSWAGTDRQPTQAGIVPRQIYPDTLHRPLLHLIYRQYVPSDSMPHPGTPIPREDSRSVAWNGNGSSWHGFRGGTTIPIGHTINLEVMFVED
ncbi:unnamed protein product, partial [Nezara viridula]